MSSNIRPMKVEIHSISREFDRFFKIDQYDTSHEGYDGKIYRNKWLVFERGDAVAVVLYRKDTHEIVLVRQFRAPTLRPLQSNGKISWQGDGQLDEVIAGMPRPGESHEDCAIREVFEETRYRVAPDKLEKIASFYVSPGGTSERIFLFYAEVTAADQAPPPAGDASSAGNSAEHESTLVRHVPVFEFHSQLIHPKRVVDSKLLIASELLRQRIGSNVFPEWKQNNGSPDGSRELASNFRTMKVEVHGISREFDRFFKIDQYDTSHEGYNGKIYRNKWLVFERGDAVAVVLYRRDRREVVIVRQFRAPTLRPLQSNGKITWQGDGQLDEVIAGMPRLGETLEDCAIRVVFAETRYRVASEKLEQIASFYVSPGGTSERIFLFYAEVTENNLDAPTGSDQTAAGSSDEQNSTLVHHVHVTEFLSKLTHPSRIIDSKLLIASMLVRKRCGYQTATPTQPARPVLYSFQIRSHPHFSIVLRTGDMFAIDDVDAWINSENTSMEMDRLIGASVSARIRYAGAYKNKHGQILEDTVADALRIGMHGRHTSPIGTVHDTTSGNLLVTNNVKRIFHVASVTGMPGEGITIDPNRISEVTNQALTAVEDRNRQWGTSRCKSALLPLIGTGDGRVAVDIAFPDIVKGTLNFFNDKFPKILRSVHISAYSAEHAEFALMHLQDHHELHLIQKVLK